MSRCLDSTTTSPVFPKAWQKLQGRFVPLEGNSHRHTWQDSYEQDSSTRSLQKTDEKKPKIGSVSLCIGNKDSFYPCTLDDIKMAGKKHNLARVWMRLMKQGHLMKCMQFLDRTSAEQESRRRVQTNVFIIDLRRND